MFLFFLFCFCCFSLPCQKSISLFGFYPSTPFYRRLFVGFIFFFFSLLFPFLRFACLFDTNFPNIPFWNPICFRFWLFLFSSVVLAYVFIVYVSAFLFFDVMLALFLVFFVLFCVLFLSSFLFSFQSMKTKKTVFPAILVFSWVMLVKRVAWFLCFMFLFLFVFLVLFLSTLKHSFVLFCFCVVVLFVTRLSGLLVCILRSFFLFLFFVVLFWILSFFVVHSSQKRTPPKTGHSKNPKKQKCRKTGQKKS